MEKCTCIEDLHDYMEDGFDTLESWCANFGCAYCCETHTICRSN